MEFESDQLALVTEPKESYPPGKVFKISTQWVVKQSLIWADMVIRDAWGNEVFKAVSQWTFARKLDFLDLRTGQKVAYIKQNIMHMLPNYDISIDNNQFATVKMEWSLKQKFSINTGMAERHSVNSLGLDGPITVQGNWSAHKYEFHCGDKIIAEVHRRIWVVSDTYTVDIQPGVDVVFILACCVIIDKCSTKS